MGRKEGTGECGECGAGGAYRGICSFWNSRNLTTRTDQCQLFVCWGWALLGELNPCPSPSGLFFFGGDGERGGPCFVCGWGWGGGGSKNFRLFSDGGPERPAQWGCMVITYLIREEFKLCGLERGGVGSGSHPWRPPVRNLDGLW